MWRVEAGISELPCQKSDDSRNEDGDMMCKSVVIPECVERTVNCSSSPMIEDVEMELIEQAEPSNNGSYGTKLKFSGPFPSHEVVSDTGSHHGLHNFTIQCNNNR